MTFSIKRSCAVTVALLAFLHVCQADVPSGLFAFSFGPETAPIYDLTGSFQFNQTMIGSGETEVGLSYGIDVTQDSRGFLTGAGTTTVVVGNDFVAAEYTAKGKISRSGTDTRVTLTVRLSGEDVIGGLSTPFRISITYKFTISPDSGTLEGTARGNAKFSGLGNSRIHSDVSVGLPANANGVWTLQMNIVPLDRLGGSASVVLSNGRTLQLDLSGSYSNARDEASIKMSGFGDSRGNSLSVKLGLENRLKGKLLGQSISCDACF